MTEAAVLPLTTRTRVALAIARSLAAALGHDDVTATHIAVGLLREAENPAVGVLMRAGLDLRALRHDLEATLPPRGRPASDRVAVDLTPGEHALVEKARAESRLLGHEYIGTEHILLALLRDPASPAAQTLTLRGLSLEAALRHLEAIMSAH